jgi:hypothetical protein
MEPLLQITVAESELSRFYPLLMSGVVLRVQVGCTLKELLCRQLCLPEAYVDQRIQTLFLNGRAMDDIASVLVHDGDVIALSAAMPGLAGATLRRGGVYAELRKNISGVDALIQKTDHQNGSVTIKLFNDILKELGIIFLKKGVGIPTAKLADLLSDVPDDVVLCFQGKPVTIPSFLFNLPPDPLTWLQTTVLKT